MEYVCEGIRNGIRDVGGRLDVQDICEGLYSHSRGIVMLSLVTIVLAEKAVHDKLITFLSFSF